MRRRLVWLVSGLVVAAVVIWLGWNTFILPPSAGSVISIPAAPLEPRSGSAVVWTEDELIVWGGASFQEEPRYYSDGAAFDTETRTWRLLAESPLAGRSAMSALWTGSEVLIWGGGGPDLMSDGAAYDPSTDSWRRIADAPLSPRSVGPSAAVWTGTEAIWFGGNTSGGKEEPAQDGAAYEPATDRWRLLPADPIPDAAYHHLLWTGTEVLLFADLFIDEQGHLLENEGNPMGVAAWDPATNGWTERPPPVTGFANANLPALWTGDRVLTVSPNTYESQCCPHDGSTLPPAGGEYDPVTGAWQNTPWSPIVLYPAAPTVWSGSEALIADAANGRLGAYSPATDTWRILSMPGVSNRAFPWAVWTGSSLIVWGGTPADQHYPTTTFLDGVELILAD